MRKITPCPFCKSPNVERYYFVEGGRADPGCVDCKQTRTMRRWTHLVADADLLAEQKPGEPDFFPTPRAQPSAIEYVDLDDAESRRRWCADLGVTDAELDQAVAAVGPMPNALRFYLGSITPRYRLPTTEDKLAYRRKREEKKDAEHQGGCAADREPPLNPGTSASGT